MQQLGVLRRFFLLSAGGLLLMASCPAAEATVVEPGGDTVTIMEVPEGTIVKVMEVPSPPPRHTEQLMLRVSSLAAELLNTLDKPEGRRRPLAEGLMVCTFVDLKKMYRTSSFGRYVAEQLMSELQRQNFRVVELRKSRSVQVQEMHGEYGLSRQPDEISDMVAAGAMLTGTYLPTERDVIVNARIMDNRSSTLLASATMVFPRTELIEQLLADASTARSRPLEPLYLKRLH